MVRNRAGEGHAGNALTRRAHAGELGAVSDQHGVDVVAALLPQAPNRIDQVHGAVPGAERACEDGQGPARPALERQLTCGVGAEPHGVGAPFELDDPFGRDGRRKNRGVGRNDKIRLPALPLAPPAHRLHDQRPVQPSLPRAGVIDDGRVDFEHGHRADRPRRHHALPAEIVSTAR